MNHYSSLKRQAVVECSGSRNSDADFQYSLAQRQASHFSPNGRWETTGDQLPVRGPRNPESEAARGWLQRLDGQKYFEGVSCRSDDQTHPALAHRVTRQ